MNRVKILLVAGAVTLLMACGSSPQQKKDLAEAKLTDEKTKTMQEYKDCIKKAKENTQKLDACERILKANAIGETSGTSGVGN